MGNALARSLILNLRKASGRQHVLLAKPHPVHLRRWELERGPLEQVKTMREGRFALRSERNELWHRPIFLAGEFTLVLTLTTGCSMTRVFQTTYLRTVFGV